MIRHAAPADAGDVVKLVHQSFRPEDLALTIYGCAGMPEYLRREFAVPFSRSLYLVAEIDHAIAGFIELREGPSLNYIAIDKAHRSHGLGRQLLFTALREAEGDRLTLDVFEHNTAALAWYRRLGFQPCGRTGLWRVPSTDSAAAPLRISGMPQADIVHRAFGFSNFTLGAFSVGRLGDRWFMVTDPGLLATPGALRALATLDPGREILFRGAVPPISCEPLLWSLRMTHSLPLC